MRNFVKLAKQLKADESGASFVEYTVLIGIMLVAVIGFIGVVGAWTTARWAALAASL